MALESIHDAMDVSPAPRPVTPRPATPTSILARSLTSPAPHVPLRKASPQKLQTRRAAPTPIFAHSHSQVKGFNPKTVEPQPHLAQITASSEHAFAGKESKKKPFKPPLELHPLKQHPQDAKRVPTMEPATPDRVQYATDSRPQSSNTMETPKSSPLLPPLPPTPLSPSMKQPKRTKSSKSIGDGWKGWKQRFSAPNKGAAAENRDTTYSLPVKRPSVASPRSSPKTSDETRDSYRSGITSNSSYPQTESNNTEHTSLTEYSSQNDLSKVDPSWPETDYETDGEEDADMTVEDYIDLYEIGFTSRRPSMDVQSRRSLQDERPGSQPSASPSPEEKKKRLTKYVHRRSRSAGEILRSAQEGQHNGLLRATTKPSTRADEKRTFTQLLAPPIDSRPISSQSISSEVSRDRYGFKKSSHYISTAQYDAWNVGYSQHLSRRRMKWHILMNSYGLSTTEPYRFPPKSDKLKRFVRKGIPPEFRGAAWFWYAGGPGKMAKEPGLYSRVLQQIKNGELREQDKELIERDLQRTFPDNVRFKPDPVPIPEERPEESNIEVKSANDSHQRTSKTRARRSVEVETPILQALRRVLQAFAVHNPTIGYCQSLNFIAGLLLLFLNEDEEKAFVLLNIVTTTHLPGTHGVALEGANIDIAVLMCCIKDSLPAVWTKIDDKGGSSLGTAGQALRLPTVSLATTAWFMSLFVGTLPIECVLRVWDCLFFEGSKTLFRIALAVFKFAERQILAIDDPMEIFQMVQTIPRSMLDINGLMEVCFRRRGGFGHISQDLIERRREERRLTVRAGVASVVGDRGWRARLRARTRIPS